MQPMYCTISFIATYLHSNTTKNSSHSKAVSQVHWLQKVQDHYWPFPVLSPCHIRNYISQPPISIPPCWTAQNRGWHINCRVEHSILLPFVLKYRHLPQITELWSLYSPNTHFTIHENHPNKHHAVLPRNQTMLLQKIRNQTMLF